MWGINRKLLPVTGNLSHDRKVLLVKGNFFLWFEILSFEMKILFVTRNVFLWQEIFSCDRDFLPVTGNKKFSSVKGKIILQQKVSSCDRKFSSVTEHFFLSQEMSPWDRKFLPVTQSFLHQNFYPGQDISGIFQPSDIKSWQKCLIFGYISKLWQKCLLFVQNFAREYKTSCQDSWYLGR